MNKTESQQTEIDKYGVTEVTGGKVSTGLNADEKKSNKLKTKIYPQGV